MTPVIFTLFSAAKLLFRQLFQGFESRAFCVDSHFECYLHDFVIVLMILHWKCFFWFPYVQKTECLLFFTCKSLPRCQVISTEHPSAHCISRQNCIYSLRFSDLSLDYLNVWMPTPWDIFLQSRPAAVEALSSVWPKNREFWFSDELHLAMLHLVTFSSHSFTLCSPGFVDICINFGRRCCALQQTTLDNVDPHESVKSVALRSC